MAMRVWKVSAVVGRATLASGRRVRQRVAHRVAQATGAYVEQARGAWDDLLARSQPGGAPPLALQGAACAPGHAPARWSTQEALERASEALRQHVWLAVPKKKKSYSKTRQRVNAPNKRIKNAAHFYPCMRCDKGLLKLRHHLCPCDLEAVKAKNVVRVAYGDNGPLQGAPNRKEAAASASGDE